MRFYCSKNGGTWRKVGGGGAYSTTRWTLHFGAEADEIHKSIDEARRIRGLYTELGNAMSVLGGWPGRRLPTLDQIQGIRREVAAITAALDACEEYQLKQALANPQEKS